MKFFCIPIFACRSAISDTLDYSQLRLEEVPKEVFRARKILEELSLNVNGIEDLPFELFRCSRLKKLDVSENKVKKIPPEVGFLQCLMELNCSKNEIVELSEELGQCINLVILNISTNIVTELPSSIARLTQLTTLNISNNSLTQLPFDINQLTNLQHLDAGQCEIRSLPPSIVLLRRLKVLDLCENYLTELPDGMDNLVSLETLDLRNNMLMSIPNGLLGCASLKNLDLSSNSLSLLPDDIGDLSNLNELTLCENKIITIPSSIGKLKHLEILKISRNCLTALTPAICSCVELRDLCLCENQLTELPSSMGNLKRLRFLDVSSNQLSTIPATIGGCAALGVLALRQNKISVLPMEIGRLAELRVLDVADNELQYLPYTVIVLYENRKLSALWLSVHQPPLPKLTEIFEPKSHIKVLTCCYLPQKGENALQNRSESKSCIGGARVCFSSEFGGPLVPEDEEDKIPIGKFERYDTPHPKPFAPKNRLSRNSGDFTQLIEKANEEKDNESRPLRSVLKRRPVSTYSEDPMDEAALITKFHESRTRVIEVDRSDWQLLGWSIYGDDMQQYKGNCGVYVSKLEAGGLAEKAGFHLDDRLLAVNGTTLRGLAHGDVVELIRDAGDVIEFKIERIPPNEPLIMAPKAEPELDILEMDAEPQPTLRPHIAEPIVQPQTSKPQIPKVEPTVPKPSVTIPTTTTFASTSSFSREPQPSMSHARSFTSLFDGPLPPHPPPPAPPRRSSSQSDLFTSQFSLTSADFKAILKDVHFNIPPRPVKNPQPLRETSEGPIAASSPIPPATSRIPMRVPVRPPPVAPKPSSSIPIVQMPEKMDFNTKLKSFEQRIQSQSEAVGSSSKSNGPAPPKKPLLSSQDRLKLKEEESRQNGRGERTGEAEETNYETILTNSIGPSTPRSRLEEEEGRSPSQLEVLDADFKQRQATRKAHLSSMDVTADRTEQMLKIISGIAPSPIPT